MALPTLRASCQVLVALFVVGAPVSLRTAQAAPAPVPQSRQTESARPIAGDDTAIVHRELRKAIERFQDSWRKTWKRVEIKRHNTMNLSQIRGWGVRADGIIEGTPWEGDRSAMNMTPELRRYLAILCNIDSPSDQQIEYIKSRKAGDIGSKGIFKAEPIGMNAPGSKSPLSASAFESELSFLSPRIIRPSPNYGSVCPAWVPSEERLPLDEGESIDLALPPVSREPLRREREVLIATLANAKTKYPHDEWITGQHLRFIIDQRSPTRALEAARVCKGSTQFCAAMMGLALEFNGRPLDAEATFRFADSVEIARPKASDAPCINSETLLLLASKDQDDAKRGSCQEQREFEKRMWWLADPMWSVPGNERYTAHMSRRTHATLRAALDRDERYTWARLGGGEAFRELIVRYGWPGYTYWPGNQLEEEINKVRENPARPRVAFPPYTAVEYSSDRTALVPAIAAIQDPFKAKPNHWDLRLREGSSLDLWWPQEHMMLWMQLHALEPGQQTQWRRDSTVVLGMVVDNPLFSLDTGARGPLTAALVASTGANDIRTLWRSALLDGEVLRMRGEFPSQPVVISAEIQARTPREPAQRLRFGMHPVPSLRDMKATDVAMSEPSFLRVLSRDDILPNNLDAATMFMTGSLDFGRTEQLALFWESYGFPAEDSVQFQLRVNRNDDVGLARRLGAAFGVVSGLRDSVSIKWTEPNAAGGGASVLLGVKPVIGRSVALDLKALPAGDYIVSIEMRGTGGRVAKTERKFILR